MKPCVVRTSSALLIASVAMVAGIVLGTFLPSRFEIPRFVSEVEYEQDMARFSRIAEEVAAMLQDEGGRMPSDPYHYLVCDKAVLTMPDLIWTSDVLRFDPLRTLARVKHEDLSANRRLAVAWLDPPYPGETWVIFTDGSWERLGADDSADNRQLGFYQQERWRAAERAGYPLWGSPSERDAWINEHWDTLVWDSDLRMYVVRQHGIPREGME